VGVLPCQALESFAENNQDPIPVEEPEELVEPAMPTQIQIPYSYSTGISIQSILDSVMIHLKHSSNM